MSQRLTRVSLFAALAFGSAGMAFAGWIWVSLLLLLVALAFTIWSGLAQRIPSMYWLVIILILAVWGTLAGAPVLTPLLSVLAVLVYWDLVAFTSHIATLSPGTGRDQLEKNHLRRLALVAGLSLLLGTTAIIFRYNLTLGWAVFLGLLLVAGIRYLTTSIR